MGLYVARDTWTPNVPASLTLFAMFANAFNFDRKEFTPFIFVSVQSILPELVLDNVSHNGQSVIVDVSNPNVNVLVLYTPNPCVAFNATTVLWFAAVGIASQPDIVLLIVISTGVAGVPKTIVYAYPFVMAFFVTLVIVVTVDSASIRASTPRTVSVPSSHGMHDVVWPL